LRDEAEAMERERIRSEGELNGNDDREMHATSERIDLR